MKTNYRLKDGDKVKLKSAAVVGNYFYDPEIAPRGVWSTLTLLPGTVGTVVKARTPKVTAKKGDSLYFANIDIPYMETVYRVRVDHAHIKRIK
jgi:hypothetical protein